MEHLARDATISASLLTIDAEISDFFPFSFGNKIGWKQRRAEHEMRLLIYLWGEYLHVCERVCLCVHVRGCECVRACEDLCVYVWVHVLV